jgi:hypothetical protein
MIALCLLHKGSETMRVDPVRLTRDIHEAASYLSPSRIVLRYLALTGAASLAEIPLGVTMAEMIKAVVSAEAGRLGGDSTSDTMSSLVSE